jgi:hypothetical protein
MNPEDQFDGDDNKACKFEQALQPFKFEMPVNLDMLMKSISFTSFEPN